MIKTHHNMNQSLSHDLPVDDVIIMSDEEIYCLEHPHWMIFLLAIIVPYLFGLLSILVCRCFKYTCCRSKAEYLDQDEECHEGRQLNWAEKWLSHTTAWGRVLGTITLFMAIISLIIFAIDARGPMDSCIMLIDNPTQQADLVLNFFFLVHFFIRISAAHNKLQFMWELITLVDFCTIPPLFVAIYFYQSWLGLRFLRAFHLMSLPEVLTYANLLKTGASYHRVQVASNLVALALVVANAIYVGQKR